MPGLIWFRQYEGRKHEKENCVFVNCKYAAFRCYARLWNTVRRRYEFGKSDIHRKCWKHRTCRKYRKCRSHRKYRICRRHRKHTSFGNGRHLWTWERHTRGYSRRDKEYPYSQSRKGQYSEGSSCVSISCTKGTELWSLFKKGRRRWEEGYPLFAGNRRRK